MPSLYVILEREIPNTDIYVNGNSLSRNNDELEKFAKQIGVRTLMSFFSISRNEFASLAEEHGVDLPQNKATLEEYWFPAEEGLRTIHALSENLAGSAMGVRERVESELREFAAVLERAKAHGIRWHLGIDY